MKIHIETHDRELPARLFESKNMKKGMSREIPGGATLKLHNIVMCKGTGIPDVLDLIVDGATSVGASLVAGWLFSKFRKPTSIERLRIEKKEVKVDKDQILNAVEEVIEYERKQKD